MNHKLLPTKSEGVFTSNPYAPSPSVIKLQTAAPATPQKIDLKLSILKDFQKTRASNNALLSFISVIATGLLGGVLVGIDIGVHMLRGHEVFEPMIKAEMFPVLLQIVSIAIFSLRSCVNYFSAQVVFEQPTNLKSLLKTPSKELNIKERMIKKQIFSNTFYALLPSITSFLDPIFHSVLFSLFISFNVGPAITYYFFDKRLPLKK